MALKTNIKATAIASLVTLIRKCLITTLGSGPLTRPQQTTSKGPSDPNNAITMSAYVNSTPLLLGFLFPNGTVAADDFSSTKPPWEQPGLASNYPDIDALLAAMNNGDATIYAAVPFNYLCSFHPKSDPYGVHAQLFFSTIADNRGMVSAQHAST